MSVVDRALATYIVAQAHIHWSVQPTMGICHQAQVVEVRIRTLSSVEVVGSPYQNLKVEAQDSSSDLGMSCTDLNCVKHAAGNYGR